MIRKIPVIDLTLSIVSIWWAIVLFTNPHFLDRVPTRLEGLAGLQETGWAFVFLTSAALKIFGALLMQKQLRKLGLLTSTFLFGLITAGYILGGSWLNTATGTYFALSVLAIWGIREVNEGHA